MVIWSRHRRFAINRNHLTVFLARGPASGKCRPARRLTGFIFRHLSACSNINQVASEFHEKESH